MNPLFQEELQVVNVGLPAFAEAIRTAGGTAVQVEWAPPGQGDPQVARQLARLINHPAVEAANQQAFAAYQSAQPVLEGIAPARAVVPGMGERTILHSGPPIAWARMCGPMQGAIIGAILYEGWAQSHAEASALVERGEVDFAPCHHHRAVGPMAGVISPSMPVWIVLNREHGNRAYCNLNEGLGKVLRFGANGPEVIDRLKWMAEVLAPTLAAALEALGGLELKPLMAQALHMGDEVHNRNVAASALLLKRLVPALLRTDAAPADIAAVVEFIAGNDHFFLNLSMAACKAMLDAAAGVPGSSMVTAMARNGVEFGIRLSGTGETWFTAPAPVVDGLLFPGYTHRGCRPRPRRQRDHRDRGRRRLRDGGGAGDRAVRRRQPAGRDREHRRDGPHHARPQRRLHPAGDRFRRHARRHRRAQGGRYRDRADHQHRHRASRRRASARSAPASPARRSPASPRRSSPSPSGSRDSE